MNAIKPNDVLELVCMATESRKRVKPPPPDSDRPVWIRGHVNSWTGFGKLLLESHSGLSKQGIECKIDPRVSDEQNLPLPEHISGLVGEPESGDRVLVVDGLMFSGHRGDTNKTAAFTMWETSGVPAELVNEINKTQLVITPSRFCADVFAASGVLRPIRIVPLGIDPSDFEELDQGPPEDMVRFGCMGWVSNSYFRKGLDDVVAAFRAAFPPDVRNVRLEVKVWPRCVVRGWEGDDRITINRDSLDRMGLVRWFRSLTAFVSASRGEGWGLCVHEALASGRPVIATNWSGHAELIGEDTGIVLPYRLEVPTDKAYRRKGRWAVPDFDGMVEAMKTAANNPSGLTKMAQPGIARAKTYTWDRMSCGLLSALREEGFA